MPSELIEDKGWKFKLYKENGKLVLYTPKSPPAPGFDIVHVLTDQESAAYHKNGSEALDKRIADMDKNFRQYKMISWR